MAALRLEKEHTRSIQVLFVPAVMLGILLFLSGGSTAQPAGAVPLITPTGTPTATATITSTPVPVESCGVNANYIITQSSGQLVPGTTDLNVNCMGCTTQILLPFSFTFYGREFSSVMASSAGNLQFSSNDPTYVNSCLPRSTLNDVIYADWEDYARTDCTGCGVFTSVSGNAPNRIFNIEWRAVAGWPQLPINFEVRLYEGENRFDLVYGQMDRSGTESTVGVQRDTGSHYTQYECSTGGLAPNLVLTFTQPECATPTGTLPTSTPTRTAVAGTPTPSCGTGANYSIVQSQSNIVTANVDTGNHCDDCTTEITLPFTYTLYGQQFNSAVLSSNGTMQFTGNNSDPSSSCLPLPSRNNTILAYASDLTTEVSGAYGCNYCGIYTYNEGTPGSRIFYIEWRANTVTNPPSYTNFEILLYEGQNRFDLNYSTINQAYSDYTVGVQNGTGEMYRQFSCQQPLLRVQNRLTFQQPDCVQSPTPNPTVTGTPPTATATQPPVESCGVNANYAQYQTTGQIVPGTLDTGNHCDGCTTGITLPFTYSFYGQPFNTARVSSYGHLQFTSDVESDITNSCIPNSNYNNVIFAYWSWQHTVNSTGCSECGVFTSVSGAAPNRIFNIEWHTVEGNGVDRANFEIRLHEADGRFDLVYGQIDNGGRAGVIGVQRDTGSHFTQYICRPFAPVIDPNLMLVFEQPECSSSPTPTVTPGGPTLTPSITPTPTACGLNTDYAAATSTATIVPGLDDTGNHCDECFTNMELPFAYSLYGQSFTSANVSANGTLQFNSNNTEGQNYCLPAMGFYNTIFAYWDNLRTDSVVSATVPTGIFTSVSGVAPNRVFNVEWRACERPGDGSPCPDTDTNFEVRLHEGQATFDIVYGQMAEAGSGATIGVQRGVFGGVNHNTQWSCNTGLAPGLAVTFSLQCGTPGVPGGGANGGQPGAGDGGFGYIDGPGRVPAEGMSTPFALDLMMSSENIGASASQSYITFPYSQLRVVDPSTGSCDPVSQVSADTTVFDRVLQNEVCNGPSPCNFRGNFVAPGTIAFASAAYANQSMQGSFHVARIALCAATQGPAVLHWQIAPYAPPNRNSALLDPFSNLTSNTSLYTDFVIEVGGAGTPQPTATQPPSGTAQPTTTHVPGSATATSTAAHPTATVPAEATPTATSTAGACQIEFDDVPQGSTFFPYVRCLACNGVLGGYPDNTFRPNNSVSRGQLSKIVSNAAGWTEPPSGRSFEDVEPGSTFFDYVERISAHGVVSGYPCGGPGEPCGSANRPYFRPDNNATRGQISKIVAKAHGYEDPMSGQTFQDVEPGSTFYNSIENLAIRGMMSGYPCGGPGEPCVAGNLPYFRTYNNATRGQLAKIVSNTFFPGCQALRR